jgi:hypothetical protein
MDDAQTESYMRMLSHEIEDDRFEILDLLISHPLNDNYEKACYQYQ